MTKNILEWIVGVFRRCRIEIYGYRVFIWKKPEKKWCSTETMKILPHVGKAKLRLRGVSFFNFKTLFNFPAVCLQLCILLNVLTASKTYFGFTNIGSKMHRFWDTGLYFYNFWSGTPCSWKLEAVKVLKIEKKTAC